MNCNYDMYIRKIKKKKQKRNDDFFIYFFERVSFIKALVILSWLKLVKPISQRL